MFGPEGMAKLMANPKIAGYLQDPQFSMMLQMCQQNPQMLMQLMQTDPRYMEVFSVLTGLDLSKMGAGGFGGAGGPGGAADPTGPSPADLAAAKAKAEAEEKEREEEQKRKEEAEREAAMTDDERKEKK